MKNQTMDTSSLPELVDNILDKLSVLSKDMLKSADGNKSAAKRARVTSIEITKMLKQYREVSVHM